MSTNGFERHIVKDLPRGRPCLIAVPKGKISWDFKITMLLAAVSNFDV